MVGAYLGYWGVELKHGLAAVEEHSPVKTEENKKAFEDGYNDLRNRGGILLPRSIV